MMSIQKMAESCLVAFYKGDASFEHFIKETLEYLKVEVPQANASKWTPCSKL